MDVVHTATASASTSEAFRCARCGYAGIGHASTVEQANVNQGGFMFGNERAGEMARDEAEARAWQEALSDVAMAPCPRCGAVDRSAWIAWLTRLRNLGWIGVGTVSLLFGLLLCFAMLNATSFSGAVGAAVFGLATVPAGIALGVAPIAKKRRSTRRVRFEPTVESGGGPGGSG